MSSWPLTATTWPTATLATTRSPAAMVRYTLYGGSGNDDICRSNWATILSMAAPVPTSAGEVGNDTLIGGIGGDDLGR